MSEFQPSKLGTKEHWDDVYEEEIKAFEDIGSEGEVWFGEDTMEKMVDWVLTNAPPSPKVLEIGTGNGVLLCELVKHGYDPSQLLGIDYSPGSVTLSMKVAKSRGIDELTFKLCDFMTEELPRLSDMRPGIDLWDLLLDKGTFDAIGLAKQDVSGKSLSDLYPVRVSKLLRPGGLFLITSCNFTEEELKAKFVTAETELDYHSRIQHRTYSYGGKSGSVCSSLGFQRRK